MTSVVKKKAKNDFFLYIVNFWVERPIFCSFMNLRVVIKLVFHGKYILTSFRGFLKSL